MELKLKESLHPQRHYFDDEGTDTEAREKHKCTPLIEEYRLKAPKVLAELDVVLCHYAQCGHEVPRGLTNILNYTWKELTADDHLKPSDRSQSQMCMSKQRRDKTPSVSSRKWSNIQTKVMRNEPLGRGKGAPTELKQRVGMACSKGMS